MIEQYWLNLEKDIESRRLKQHQDQKKFRQSIEGQIQTAYEHFCLWCRCKGYDPYTKTFELIKEYLDNNQSDEFKDEDRKLFQPETPDYVKNKKMLKQIVLTNAM